MNWPPSEWRPLGEVWHGGWLPEWTSVRRSLRPWRTSTSTGGHSGGCKWPPKVLGMRRSRGMNCSPHLHQGLKVWLRPWPNVLWNVKVQGEDVCLPAPSILNIGQFLTDQEAEGGMGEPHWFVAYSCTLQRVGKVARRRKWEAQQEALEIKASPLVHAFWCETDVDLTMASVKCCWEPTPRTLHHQRENGPTAHVISYLDVLAVPLPTSEAWDEMVWPTTAPIP